MTTSNTPGHGVVLTAPNRVAGYSACRRSAIVVVGTGDCAADGSENAALSRPRHSALRSLLIVIVVSPLVLCTFGELRKLLAILGRRIERTLQGGALGDHHIDRAPGVHLDDREHFLREADVVLGEPVQRAADAGAESGLELLGGIHCGGCAKRGHG